MAFKFLEHMATADTAFEATGKDLVELFESAGQAVIESVANSETVKPEIVKEINIENKDVEKLLYDFLEELVFLKDAEYMVFSEVKCEIEDGKLKAVLKGDKIKKDEQELRQDVKAVTMHYFTIEQTEEGWRAQVVLDI